MDIERGGRWTLRGEVVDTSPLKRGGRWTPIECPPRSPFRGEDLPSQRGGRWTLRWEVGGL